MTDLSHELSGTYTRQTDGKSVTYWGRLDGVHYQVRVWPANEKPADIDALPIAYEGELIGERGAADPDMARKVIENFLEDWRPFNG